MRKITYAAIVVLVAVLIAAVTGIYLLTAQETKLKFPVKGACNVLSLV